jgi:hypothetical protein
MRLSWLARLCNGIVYAPSDTRVTTTEGSMTLRDRDYTLGWEKRDQARS